MAAKVQCGPQEDLDSKTTAFISYIHQSFPGSTMQVRQKPIIVVNYLFGLKQDNMNFHHLFLKGLIIILFSTLKLH